MTYYHEEAALYVTEKISLDQNKKTIFLVGDSIRMGYCGYTKEYLKDVADVAYPDDNCRYTQYTYVGLSQWKNIFPDPSAVDCVYWNNGHWDIAHWDNEPESLNSINDYCEMLVRIYEKIKRLFPNAKIVFGTTLPMNPNGMDWMNQRTTEEIRAYNQAAIEALTHKDIYIDDAFALFEDKPSSYFIDYCHLTEEGFEILGKHVGDYIMRLFDE
ncbi:MAG: SGNH/GDSL hydrolase family protein [Clostridia bacterium]|nr:SGNH/GDSL hydrolase family protein [Clostridia bacterium]